MSAGRWITPPGDSLYRLSDAIGEYDRITQDLADKLRNNEPVNRWLCYSHRRELRKILTGEALERLEQEIESARDSM